MADAFEKRLRRAEFLRKEWPFASDLLAFHSRILSLQQEALTTPGGEPFAGRLEAVVRRHGPAELAQREEPFLEFCRRVTEQVQGMADLRSTGEPSAPGDRSAECPACSGAPQVSVLREDKNAETVRRSLVCARCFLEWPFARVLCPSCGEEKPEKLPRYTAQEIPWMRVEACDTCRKFIKSVDLTLNWEADPVVDELASTPLDMIARDHGYVKITPNLAGI